MLNESNFQPSSDIGTSDGGLSCNREEDPRKTSRYTDHGMK